MPVGNDARRGDAAHDYQDLYARSTRDIHVFRLRNPFWLFAYSAA
jgi:hypothetical protein